MQCPVSITSSELNTRAFLELQNAGQREEANRYIFCNGFEGLPPCHAAIVVAFDCTRLYRERLQKPLICGFRFTEGTCDLPT